MLILSRKKQQSVMVGTGSGVQYQLKVTVLAISGDRVKLGFEVDTEVPVHRSEIWERMQATGELPTLCSESPIAVSEKQ